MTDRAQTEAWGILDCAGFDEPRQVEDRLVSIWAVTAGEATNVGSGFVVASGTGPKGHHAVIVTAAHVAISGLDFVRPNQLRNRVGLFSYPIGRFFSAPLRSEKLFVVFNRRHPALGQRVRSIGALSINEGCDLCVLQTTGDSTELPAVPALAINSDPLVVGQTVIMVGYPKLHDPHIPVLVESARSLLELESVNQSPQIRTGVIASVEEQLRHKPVFGYETTIPMPPGMSGAPVFTMNDGFSSLEVVGVCVSDSPSENGDDQTPCGSSFVIGAQNLHGLAVPNRLIIEAWLKDQQNPQPFGAFFIDSGRRQGELEVVIGEDSVRAQRRS